MYPWAKDLCVNKSLGIGSAYPHSLMLKHSKTRHVYKQVSQSIGSPWLSWLTKMPCSVASWLLQSFIALHSSDLSKMRVEHVTQTMGLFWKRVRVGPNVHSCLPDNSPMTQWRICKRKTTKNDYSWVELHNNYGKWWCQRFLSGSIFLKITVTNVTSHVVFRSKCVCFLPSGGGGCSQ